MASNVAYRHQQSTPDDVICVTISVDNVRFFKNIDVRKDLEMIAYPM